MPGMSGGVSWRSVFFISFEEVDMSRREKDVVGVGIDTGRYGHRATFLRGDQQPAAEPLDFSETAAGHEQLAAVLKRLQSTGCQIHVHLDAAGQYATNLERFLRELPAVSLSVGEPKRNKDYHAAISPKRKSDATESYAMARFAIAERPTATAAVPAEIRALSEVTSRLKVKVCDCTRAANRLHNLMARVFPELALLVPRITVAWLLELLDKYPTPIRIARARLATLERISRAPKDTVRAIHKSAASSVGTMSDEAAEALVRLAVDEVRQVAKQRKSLEKLLELTYTGLPAGGHQQLTTIPGIGVATAAVLVSKVVSIKRFDTAEKLVGFFGVFPREYQSGVDKSGEPNPSKTKRMSQQGNDLARAYLYSAAATAARCNPAVRSLYRRLRARGTRYDVAMGHCMRKLLHLAFAVWNTGKPFDPEHYPWEAADQDTTNQDTASLMEEQKKAAGHTRDVGSKRSVVTTANAKVDPQSPQVNALNGDAERIVDYQAIRLQVSLKQIMEHLGLMATLRLSAGEHRGPCPIHGKGDRRRRDFAINLDKNVFCCHHPSCQARGNHLDLWALLHNQTPYEAANDLAATFNLSIT